MTNLKIIDGNEAAKYVASSGAGTDGDPYVLSRSIDQTTPGTTNRVAVGGGIVIPQTPTITVDAYSAGDAVGEKLTFAGAVRVSGGSGKFSSLVIIDKGDVKAELRLWLFGTDFTAPADKAPFAISDADLANCIGVLPVSVSDYASAADNGVATVPLEGLVFQAVATTIYGQLQCVGTPTYAETDGLIVKLGIEYKD